MEMAEIPPAFIKVDIRLICDIHLAPSRQDIFRAILQVSHNLGVQVIAEGIEKKEESAFCLAAGCRLGQGYLFGRPQAIALVGKSAGDAHMPQNATRITRQPRHLRVVHLHGSPMPDPNEALLARDSRSLPSKPKPPFTPSPAVRVSCTLPANR